MRIFRVTWTLYGEIHQCAGYYKSAKEAKADIIKKFGLKTANIINVKEEKA